jgi:hypothetical protein
VKGKFLLDREIEVKPAGEKVFLKSDSQTVQRIKKRHSFGGRNQLT